MRRSYERLVWLTIAAIFASFAISHGTPSFRHDWMWPTNHEQFFQVLRESFSGWSTDGLGNPSPRMLGFVVNSPIVLIGIVFGPMAALFIWSFLIASVIGYGARRICFVLEQHDMCTKCAATLLATFNPWTYDHLVAGHTHMLLAFGATLALVSHALQKTASNAVRENLEATLLVALAMPQLQYLVLDAVPITVIALRRRTVLPLIGFAFAALPTLIGITLDLRQLANTPYTLAWEQGQGVPLQEGWRLAGYFGGYDSALPQWNSLVLELMVIAIVAGALLARRRLGFLSVLVAAALLFAVSGTSHPIGSAVLQIMARLPALRAFRELNDLLGFVLAAYIVAFAVSAQTAIFRRSTAAVSLVLLLAWTISPPGKFWIDGRSVAPLNASVVEPQSRFALFPAFQPLTYLRQGSGVDIQSFDLPNDRVPLNEYLAQYPASVALTMYRNSGDAHFLKALSVSALFERASYASVARIFAPRGDRHYANSVHVLRGFTPMISVCDAPLMGALDANFGACNEFIGDTPGNDFAIRPMSGPQETTNAGSSWIDARLVFPLRPNLGQAFGGAYTTSAASLPVPGNVAVLAEIQGRLSTDAGQAFLGNGSYRWLKLAEGVHSVKCSGECLIAAIARHAPDSRLPLNPPARPFLGLQFTEIAPWLSLTHPPKRGVLRYNITFNRGWLAADRCGALPHVRLDAIVNGWVLRPCSAGGVVVAFVPAVAQFTCAMFALLWFLGALYRYLLQSILVQSAPFRRHLFSRG